MNPQQEAVALFRYLESRGIKPSVRSIGRILREELSLRFTDKQLREWLSKFIAAAAPQSAAIPPQKTSTNAAVPPQSAAIPPQLRAQNKVSLVPDLELPISSFDKSNSEMGSAAPEQPKQRRKATPSAPKAEKPKPDPATWTEPLRAAVQAVWRTPLRDLTPDERFSVARYHCLKFANCTRDEGLNKRHALKIASGLANLATHRQHGAMTVDDYVNAADEAWRQGGERPMFRAWAATAFADAFTAPPPPNSRSPSPPQGARSR